MGSESDIFLAAQKGYNDQNGTDALGRSAGNGNACHAQPADNDEEKVHHYIGHPGGGQKQQRLLGIAHCAEHGVAKIIDRHGGHSQKVNAQIKRRVIDQHFLGVEQFQHGPGEQLPQHQNDHALQQAQNQRSMDGFRHIAVAAGAKIAGHHHVDPIAHANQKAGKQRHQNRRRADGTQCFRPHELADHHNVRHVEQSLKQIRNHQRDAEQENLPGQLSFGQVLGDVHHCKPSAFRQNSGASDKLPL